MPYKRLSQFSRYFLSPKFWLFGAKLDFFNTHRRLHSLRIRLMEGEMSRTHQGTCVLENYIFLTPFAEINKAHLYGRPTEAILAGFLTLLP